MKKIGLLGGSFDPIHIGHIHIAKIALDELNLDEVQLIPTLNNPWKDGNNTSVDHRLNMLNIAINENEKISINTIELDMKNNEKNYTIHTLELLTDHHPDTQYYYIMGMDQANSFHKWKEAKKISELVQLVAFFRAGYCNEDENIKKYHFRLLNNIPIHASSSEIRSGCIDMLDKNVLKYITSHGLYLEGIISSRMKEKRWKHSISVANLAREIAEANGLDERAAYIAGMLHDIAKELPYDQALEMMKAHFPQYVNKPEPIWHQWLSRYVSEHEYLIDDPVILDAIEHHTTADIHISPIGKCIYVADKLDPLRGYDSSKEIQNCKNDIHSGFKQSLIDFYEFSKAKGRNIDECFYEIYEHFVEKGEI